MSPTSAPEQPGNAALQRMLQRRSAWPLAQPGPDEETLQRILGAAACAPDHAGLMPWRFKYVRDGQRQQLLQQVLACPEAQTPQAQDMHGKFTAKLTTAPVVIVLAERQVPHPKAPDFEQTLACGAAVMNMLNAAHFLGFHGFWSTAPGVLPELLKRVMGFEPGDRILGLLNLGTPPHTPSTPPRPQVSAYAQPWPSV